MKLLLIATWILCGVASYLINRHWWIVEFGQNQFLRSDKIFFAALSVGGPFALVAAIPCWLVTWNLVKPRRIK